MKRCRGGIATNNFAGIRAGLCPDTDSAHQSAEHDHINVLMLRARVVAEHLAYELVVAFLGAKESQERRHL